MPPSPDRRYTAFEGHDHLAAGPLSEVTLAVKAAEEQGVAGALLVFDDATGHVVDVDTRGSAEDILARLAAPAEPAAPVKAQVEAPAAPRGRGRPKLGVTAREVTLLPRHWEWLQSQPGGASATLRKLVEEARRRDRDSPRQARDAAYHFMSALAGDLPGFEAATRALFAGDGERFDTLIAAWPPAVRDHCRKMTARAFPVPVAR
ncbi:MAG: DUF2239 family protein [Kiloniellaceae bacterium]